MRGPPLFVQFLDLYGSPVYVRPDRVVALKGIAVTWAGEPKRGTLIVLDNREVFRVRGDVDAIKDGVEGAALWAENDARLANG
jgi:hypothetical protein